MTARCDFSDLPADQCGCTHCKPEVSEYADAVVGPAFSALYSSVVDCGHHVTAGNRLAYTDAGELICGRCMPRALD